jgi:hypothetical protein
VYGIFNSDELLLLQIRPKDSGEFLLLLLLLLLIRPSSCGKVQAFLLHAPSSLCPSSLAQQ